MVSIFFQTLASCMFSSNCIHRNRQLLISLEQSETPSIYADKFWGMWLSTHQNTKCEESEFNVFCGKVYLVQDLSSQGVLNSKVHILNLSFNGYCVPVYLCIQCSVFFMKWIIIVCGLSSEVNILGYATSTSYTAINMTAEGVYIECNAYSAHIQVYIINYEKRWILYSLKHNNDIGRWLE